MPHTVFVGDVHGKINDFIALPEIAEKRPDDIVVQLGDMGVGFVGVPSFPAGYYFIRGNHDEPFGCWQNGSYLGDWGQFRDLFFFVSGACSLDKECRVLGRDYWDDEELSYEQLSRAAEYWGKSATDVIASHDCPEVCLRKIYPSWVVRTRTAGGLQAIYETRQPSLWVFAHHHQKINFKIGRTRFIGLSELGTHSVDL
jgi:hypothetical protein